MLKSTAVSFSAIICYRNTLNPAIGRLAAFGNPTTSITSTAIFFDAYLGELYVNLAALLTGSAFWQISFDDPTKG